MANPIVIVVLIYAIQLILIYVLWATDKKLAAVIDVVVLFIRLFINFGLGVNI